MTFFFSSRRRHTRWPRDWSSDVCSSDLGIENGHGDGSWLEHRPDYPEVVLERTTAVDHRSFLNIQRSGLDEARKHEHRQTGTETEVEHHDADRDRKSTRLNSSHVAISYAVFCLTEKKSRYE